jgi:IS30 family transposase
MSNGVSWSADDDQRICDLARAGLSLGDIAIQMNRSISVIHRHAQRLRITIASDRIGLTNRLVELGLKVKAK